MYYDPFPCRGGQGGSVLRWYSLPQTGSLNESNEQSPPNNPCLDIKCEKTSIMLSHRDFYLVHYWNPDYYFQYLPPECPIDGHIKSPRLSLNITCKRLLVFKFLWAKTTKQNKNQKCCRWDRDCLQQIRTTAPILNLMKGKEAFKSADIRDGHFNGYIKGDLNLDIERI